MARTRKGALLNYIIVIIIINILKKTKSVYCCRFVFT